MTAQEYVEIPQSTCSLISMSKNNFSINYLKWNTLKVVQRTHTIYDNESHKDLSLWIWCYWRLDLILQSHNERYVFSKMQKKVLQEYVKKELKEAKSLEERKTTKEKRNEGCRY